MIASVYYPRSAVKRGHKAGLRVLVAGAAHAGGGARHQSMTIEVQAHLISSRAGMANPRSLGPGRGRLDPPCRRRPQPRPPRWRGRPGSNRPSTQSWTCLLSAIIAVKKNTGRLFDCPWLVVGIADVDAELVDKGQADGS